MSGQHRPDPTELAALRELIQSAAGLIIDESRTDVLIAAVVRRMRVSGDDRPAAYLERLTQDPDEVRELLELVVVRETYFGRIPPQIDALRRVILPDLISRRTPERRLRIWSAGCSTGEEVWTLAMVLARLLPAGWDAQIVGTDLSGQALELAEQGRYGPRAVAQLAPEELQRWFTNNGETYEISPELRPLVRFARHNLVTDSSPLRSGEQAELIVCRNVTIYFDRATTRRAVDGFRTALAADGWLMMGPSETLWRLHDGFEVVSLGEAFAYRRQQDSPLRAAPRRPATRRVLPPQEPRRIPAPVAVPAAAAVASMAAQPVPPRRAPAPTGVPIAAAAEPDAAPADITLEVIREHLLRGEYETARQAAEALAERDPLSAEAHYLQAVALVDLGRDRGALEPLRRAVFLAPRSPLPQFLLGTVLARLGQRGAATGAFAAAEYALRDSDNLDATVPELDGRRLGELAALCRQLCAGDSAR
jgi:chemotaxis protein methyltransferase CheR